MRQLVKQNVLQSLGTENFRPSIAAMCVAAIACAELPTQQWPDVITVLMSNVTNPASTEPLKESSLETLGYVCQDIDPKVRRNLNIKFFRIVKIVKFDCTGARDAGQQCPDGHRAWHAQGGDVGPCPTRRYECPAQLVGVYEE